MRTFHSPKDNMNKLLYSGEPLDADTTRLKNVSLVNHLSYLHTLHESRVKVAGVRIIFLVQ